jgi:TonB-dependent receptor
MKSLPSLNKLVRRFALGALFLPLLLGSLFAQATTGVITGRVFDERTGKSLEGAVVRVFGTNIIDHTTSDGRYSVSAPVGTAVIEFEYVGLDPLTREVKVTAGTSTSFNAPMTSAILKLDSFVVQESVRGQSLAINMQKIAPGIVNIVSEETFGQMVDSNIGTALQRLPGLSVNESQDGSAGSINIRGIEGDYNSIQIDGNRAPSQSGTSRGFDPRQLAADGVTNIEVIKAPTPDRDGDAIGGIVNIVSRTAFQRDGRAFKLRLGGVYSDLPKKWGHSASLQYSDIFSILGGQKNLGISATLSSYRTNRYSINADMDWEHVSHELYPSLGLDKYGNYPVWFFESTHFEHDTRVTDTYGLSGSIDFKIDDHNTFYVRPVYSYYKRNGTTFETDMDIDTRYQSQPGGRRTYGYLTHDSGAAIGQASQGSRGWIGTDDTRENDLYSVAFGGRHEKGDSLLTYDFFYSYSKLVVAADNELDLLMKPTNPYIEQAYKINKIHQGLVDVVVTNGVDITDLRLMTLGNVIFFNEKKDEDVYSARADWERKFHRDEGVFTFKTGAKWRSSRPKYNRDLNRWATGPGTVFPYHLVVEPTNAYLFGKPKYFDVYPNRIPALLASNPELFTYNTNASVEGSNIRDYDAEETTTAAYVMGTYRFGAHTIIGGVRFEDNEWKSQRIRVPYINGIATPQKENLGSTYDFWLPGLHLRHELRKNLIMREGFNQSYAKPKLGQLTLGRIIATNGNITDGNPKLQPATSDNFDWQIEYYTASSGLYSIGVFYKQVKDFSFQQDSFFAETDSQGEPIIIPGATSGLRYRRVVNGGTAKQKGLELIARQRLTFLPGALKGFTASASGTFTESKATYPGREDRSDLTLAGFSPFLFTTALEYARGRLFVRVDYRYRDDYVEGLGTDRASDEYYAAEERVDAEVSFQIRKGLSIFASGTNLTNRWQVSYQGYGQFVEDASLSGRKFTVGMEYKF